MRECIRLLISLSWIQSAVQAGHVLLVPTAGSPLSSTMFYGKKLHERGHNISLLLSHEWAKVDDYSHWATNASFYTTYIYSCGDDFRVFAATIGGMDEQTDADTFFKDFVKLLFNDQIPYFLSGPFHCLFGNFALWNIAHTTGICSEKFMSLDQNENIRNFIKSAEIDTILGDPLELLGPFLAWKNNISLIYNTRWGMSGDATELLIGSQSTTQSRLGASYDLDSTSRLSLRNRFFGFVEEILQRMHSYFILPRFYKNAFNGMKLTSRG